MKQFVSILMLIVMSTFFLSAGAASYDTVVTIAEPTYMRSGASTGSKVVYEVPSDRSYSWSGEMKRDGRGIVWYGVYMNGSHLWISGLHSNLINSYTGDVHNNGRNGAGSKNCSVYAKRHTDIYTGPGTQYSWVDYMDAGDGADFTGFRQNSGGRTWLQISYYGYGGWVNANDVNIR